MDFDENLIQAVQRRDALYDIRNVNDRNNIIRMQMWHDVASEVNADKKMDKFEEEIYRRMAEDKVAKRSGNISQKENVGIFHDAPVVKNELPERHVADIEMNVFSPFHSDDDTMQQANPRPGPPQLTSAETHANHTIKAIFDSKRKRIEALIEVELQRPEHDETQHFLLSLAPMLRSMNPVARLEVQMDIQAVLLKKMKEFNKNQ
ncbi:hypothetical protein CBL_08403 [Carabus blaptoides fortunei]